MSDDGSDTQWREKVSDYRAIIPLVLAGLQLTLYFDVPFEAASAANFSSSRAPARMLARP
jgi:hypothetical protein